jgi:hypothetical protein
MSPLHRQILFESCITTMDKTFKCHNCWVKPGHKFSECLSVDCTCSCVQEIYAMPPNQIEDDVAANTPKFLKIDNAKIK